MSNAVALVFRLVDDDEKDVKPGEAGEAWLKGPMVTKGYHNNAEANKSSFTHDGWFKTGDILRVEKDQLYIVDRKKVGLNSKFVQQIIAAVGMLTSSRNSSNTRVFKSPRPS